MFLNKCSTILFIFNAYLNIYFERSVPNTSDKQVDMFESYTTYFFHIVPLRPKMNTIHFHFCILILHLIRMLTLLQCSINMWTLLSRLFSFVHHLILVPADGFQSVQYRNQFVIVLHFSIHLSINNHYLL